MPVCVHMKGLMLCHNLALMWKCILGNVVEYHDSDLSSSVTNFFVTEEKSIVYLVSLKSVAQKRRNQAAEDILSQDSSHIQKPIVQQFCQDVYYTVLFVNYYCNIMSIQKSFKLKVLHCHRMSA